ncbi:MAG: hypothetical protein C4523_17735 [Myxococcales bacterium]|nr:MAG: hypothetical protein C4523_17735 [Myxococcales bacterium]
MTTTFSPPVYAFAPSVRLTLRLEGEGGKNDAKNEQTLQLGAEPTVETPTPISIIVPKRFRLERRDCFESDSLELTIPFDACPLDPRIVRAVRVELYGGLVDLKAFGAAMETGKGRPTAAQIPENLLFVGYVDDMEADVYGRKGDLTLHAQSYQSLIQDTPMSMRVADLLSGTPAMLGALSSFSPMFRMLFGGVATAWKPSQVVSLVVQSIPTLSGIKVKVADANTEKVGEIDKTRLNPATAALEYEKESVWNYLQRRLTLDGVIPYLWLDTIYLVKTANLTKNRPFGWMARHYGVINPIPNPKRPTEGPLFIVGHNITAPRIRRKLTRQAAPPIEARMYDPTQGRTHSAAFPSASEREAHPEMWTATGGYSAPQVVKLPFHPGHIDKLGEAAQTLYLANRRAPLEIEFETGDFSSAGLPAAVPDVLSLAGGDPIEVMERKAGEPNPEDADKGKLSDSLSHLNGMSVTELIDYLKAYGYEAKAAERLAGKLKSELPATYKLQRMTVDYDGEAPRTTVSLTAVSYVNVNLDTLPA